MRDFVMIGSTPNAEPCFPAGHALARKECNIYLSQLQRLFPEVDLKVKACPHDFGTYYECAAYFDDEDENTCDKALEVESNAPDFWDAKARNELNRLQASAA